jgi:hypothetical protein
VASRPRIEPDFDCQSARVHVKRIRAKCGERPLGSIRPFEVKNWAAELGAEGLPTSTSTSTIDGLHRRLSHLYADVGRSCAAIAGQQAHIPGRAEAATLRRHDSAGAGA